MIESGTFVADHGRVHRGTSASSRTRNELICALNDRHCIPTAECEEHLRTYADYRDSRFGVMDEGEERAFIADVMTGNPNARWCPHRKHRAVRAYASKVRF